MRIIILGPADLDVLFVREQLNRLTIDHDDVVRVSGEELEFTPGLQWMEHRWRKARTKNRQRFAVHRYHPLDWHKTNKKDVLYKDQWREMVQDAEQVIAFCEVGNIDFRVKGVLKMAELYDLKITKVLV